MLPLLLPFCCLLFACDASRGPVYQGGLYFGQGAYLMRFSLRDGSLSAEGHLGETTIREVSALGAGHLLIAESASVNGRSVPRISWFDLKTGESADLYQGVYAKYLPRSDVIVYDDGSRLYAVPQTEGSENEVVYAHAQNQLTRLVTAAPGILLFETREQGQPVVRSWNSVTEELERRDGLAASCRLQGAVWIGELQRLACKPRQDSLADARYLLSDLDGSLDGELPLPEDRRFLALTYIPSLHLLVLRETHSRLLGGAEKNAVWVHDLRSGESHRLADNVNLGQSVVYTAF